MRTSNGRSSKRCSRCCRCSRRRVAVRVSSRGAGGLRRSGAARVAGAGHAAMSRPIWRSHSTIACRHLLVDEFQDTSFAQLDLLERLTAGWSRATGARCFASAIRCNRSIAFVRPKSVCSCSCRRHGLAQRAARAAARSAANFRSARAPIIEWVNRVFPSVLLRRNDNAEQGAVQYSPSIAACARTRGGVQVHPSFENDDMAEARKVVRSGAQELWRDDPRRRRSRCWSLRDSHVGLIARELHARRHRFSGRSRSSRCTIGRWCRI